MENLDTKLAYKAMFRFLEKYHALTNADDIGALLGSMSMDVFRDAMPADPAMWTDWLEAIREVSAEQLRQSGQQAEGRSRDAGAVNEDVILRADPPLASDR